MRLTRRACGGLALLLGIRPGRAAPSMVDVLALRGFDPVSYFLPGGPQPGLPRFELSWKGRVWRFASAANREAFRRDPIVYAPRLAGYDAAGILEERLVDADPLVFALIGEKLYLFRNPGRRARLLAEPGLAERAEALWPSLSRLTDGGPD
ncbi:YHS domain-containing (seleno)protein [Methylobacterium trifolii]|uniref:YHS domain-containing protein n=1 Tax=Methylobacterium trifolii TaxID=1003092 RepID=A0ABQ4U269_9HYPH|nr:YHS domain-containing (seleno)protein [Methylobacterium trifolii]GJE61232.1 hypothetical protein MPOCJGCO_3353 [Methylobacterium trifolii]